MAKQKIVVEYDYFVAERYPHRGLYVWRPDLGGGAAWPLLSATPADIESAAIALELNYEDIDHAIDQFVCSYVASGIPMYVGDAMRAHNRRKENGGD